VTISVKCKGKTYHSQPSNVNYIYTKNDQLKHKNCKIKDKRSWKLMEKLQISITKLERQFSFKK
jgi:hypothetical protein